MSELLAIRGLGVTFGGLAALQGVDMSVHATALHGLIGPNGAGKSTLVNALTGVVAPTSGTIHLAGRAIHGLPGHAIARAGVARTFQNIRLFAGMTVLENTLVGAHRHFRATMADLIAGARRARDEETAQCQTALAELSFVGLGGLEHRAATTLSYGHQRRLEIARALMLGPKLLLLDEPMAGMNAAEKDELALLIRSVRDRGVAVLIIEHDMQVMRRLVDRLTVLHHGQCLADGAAAAVFDDPAVRDAYLGKAA